MYGKDDSIDLQDALFIQSSSGLDPDMVRQAVRLARIPPIPDTEEQFALATRRFFQRLASDSQEEPPNSPSDVSASIRANTLSHYEKIVSHYEKFS